MNKEDIIRMAREAGKHQWPLEPEFLERFAALVAEDCAKVADQAEPYHAADLIRARWQA
jgi:hypothetical protein